MALKRIVMLTVSAAVVCSGLVTAEVVLAQAAAERSTAATVAELSEAMKTATGPDEKCRVLAAVAKIGNRDALDLAVAATQDEEVADAAREAAGEIARAMTAPDQLPYIRRLGFSQWARCLPDSQAAKPVIDAMRGDDVVLRDAAIAVVDWREDGQLVALVAAEIGTLPAPVQRDVMTMLTRRNDEASITALLAMTRDKDKNVAATAVEALGGLGTEAAMARLKEALADADLRCAALRAYSALGATSPPDEATQAVLLDTLKQVTGDAAQAASDDAAVAAVQIAQMLVATHPDEALQALKRLDAGKLSQATQDLVAGTQLLFTIDQLPNLAKGATATSPDGLNTEGGSSGDAAAIDGNPATYWDEVDGQSLYRLRVELPQAAEVAHHNFSPRDFKIACDDKVVKTVTDATYANNRLIVPLPRTRCTSVELQITRYYGGSPGVRELGIYDIP